MQHNYWPFQCSINGRNLRFSSSWTVSQKVGNNERGPVMWKIIDFFERLWGRSRKKGEAVELENKLIWSSDFVSRLEASQTINMNFMNHFRLVQHAFLLSLSVFRMFEPGELIWKSIRDKFFLSFPMSRRFFLLLWTLLKVIKPVFFVLSPSFFLFSFCLW